VIIPVSNEISGEIKAIHTHRRGGEGGGELSVVEKMAEFEVRLADYVAFLPNFFQITGLRPR